MAAGAADHPPGVFDLVSARLADEAGFDALYMSGFAVVASHLGLPDAGLATYSDMVGRLSAIAGAVKAPLIADGDTGFGGLLNVERTVQGYVAAACRRSRDFLIIARTDARTARGLDEALRWAEAFARAGADVLFLEALESEAEIWRLCRTQSEWIERGA